MRFRTDHILFLPVLYRKTAKGEIQTWRVWSVGDQVFTEYGLLDGKIQRTVGKKCEGTNEGRSNSRDPVEQAQFEAEAMWTNRIERKYRSSLEEVKTKPVLLPMLAYDFWVRPKGKPRDLSTHAKKLDFPVFVQKKFNGCRALARREGGKVLLFSRGGKTWPMTHLLARLQWLPENIVLDGEIYKHGIPLQEICSLAKAYREESQILEYHVYDVIDLNHPEMEQLDRFELLDRLAERFRGKLVKVRRRTARTSYDIMDLERRYVKRGYEGAIVRSMESPYRFGVRSSGLLKYKSFEDAEFKVVGYREGRGKFQGCAVFFCENDRNKKTFKVTPRGTQKERREMWTNRGRYLGRRYTIRFPARTEDEIPFHPVGIAFRPKRDRA